MHFVLWEKPPLVISCKMTEIILTQCIFLRYKAASPHHTCTYSLLVPEEELEIDGDNLAVVL